MDVTVNENGYITAISTGNGEKFLVSSDTYPYTLDESETITIFAWQTNYAFSPSGRNHNAFNPCIAGADAKQTTAKSESEWFLAPLVSSAQR